MLPETLGRLQGIVVVGTTKVPYDFVCKSTYSTSHLKLNDSPEECVFVAS